MVRYRVSSNSAEQCCSLIVEATLAPPNFSHQQTGHQYKSPTELKVQASGDSWLQERGFQVGLCKLEGRKVTILSWIVLFYTKEQRSFDL